jgi:AraC family transcriptional activator of pobA
MEKFPIYKIQHFNCNSHQSDLYINTFENHLKAHPFIEEPHRHHFYVLVLFTKGSGKHTIDFDTYPIKPGSLFVLQPGQMHHWHLSNDIDGYILFYSAGLYNLHFGNKKLEDYSFYHSAKSKPELQLNEIELIEIRPYFDLLTKENISSAPANVDKILNLLDIILIEIARKYVVKNSHNNHTYNYQLNAFEKILEVNFKQEKSPSYYASKLSITLKHLNRICKETINQTATEIITQRIILEAKRMLTDQNKPINTIADELGYSNYAYFTKLFKKQTGGTPTAFRVQIQQGNNYPKVKSL